MIDVKKHSPMSIRSGSLYHKPSIDGDPLYSSIVNDAEGQYRSSFQIVFFWVGCWLLVVSLPSLVIFSPENAAITRNDAQTCCENTAKHSL